MKLVGEAACCVKPSPRWILQLTQHWAGQSQIRLLQLQYHEHDSGSDAKKHCDCSMPEGTERVIVLPEWISS
jgi:hypothetical protein